MKTTEKSENIYKSLFEHSYDAIFIIDTNGKIQNMNEKASKLTEYSLQEIGNSNIQKIIPNENKEVFKDRLSETEKLGKLKFESKLKQKGGEVITVEISNSFIKDNNLIQVIIRDTTEQKTTEEELTKAKLKAEKSDFLKSSFLANISNEIRSPMKSIIGFSKLLSNPSINNANKNLYLEAILKSGDQLLKIIDDIIEISKIEAKEIQIEQKKFNINRLMSDIYLFYKNSPPKGKNEITLKCIKELEDDSAWLYSDELRIRQILLNLITNAYNYTESGEIEFGYLLKDDNETIEFFIKDTGIGFDDKFKDVIFERFNQITSSIEKKYGGIGLGLAISKGLVEKLGGNINCSSIPKKGSSFFVSFPFISKKLKTKDEGLKYTEKSYNWEGKTILIAEDVHLNFLFFEDLISDNKATVLHAENGEEALKMAKENTEISLVLMDIMMPVMDGLTATKKIREFNKTIPILIQSAYASSKVLNKSKDAGCNDFLSKPINKDHLMETINFFLTHTPS